LRDFATSLRPLRLSIYFYREVGKEVAKIREGCWTTDTKLHPHQNGWMISRDGKRVYNDRDSSNPKLLPSLKMKLDRLRLA
jgi:hypothetical protein